MRLTVDRLNLLLEYGLSEYQGRVYLALLEFPSLPAGALAKAARYTNGLKSEPGWRCA